MRETLSRTWFEYLGSKIGNSSYLASFKRVVLTIIRPAASTIYVYASCTHTYNTTNQTVSVSTVSLNYLCEHKFSIMTLLTNYFHNQLYSFLQKNVFCHILVFVELQPMDFKCRSQ